VRVLVTGAAGFVGSNVVHEASLRGLEVVGVVRSTPPLPDPRCAYVSVDLLDTGATRASIVETHPDAIVHTAILNDLVRLYSERRLAWDSYVGATAHPRGRGQRGGGFPRHRVDRLGVRRS
jgi:nucleoside-diphosphate-sugar epimerase